MLVREGLVSVLCFLSTLFSLFILILRHVVFRGFYMNVENKLWLYLLLYFSCLAVIIRVLLRGNCYQVGIRAWLLGVVFSSGMFISLQKDSSYCIFGWYMCIMSFFHWSEYVTISVTNPATLSISSYMLRHSPHYIVAAISSWIEFWVEYLCWPGLKEMSLVSMVGLVMCIGGEVVRKLAMVTAMRNFNHIVQEEKREGHTLVTHGVYSLCRHPSYAGWFYWAVGTQFVLCNPLCIVGYILASWKFFYERITVEEVTLLNFFENDYIRYQRSVPSGLPFIEGYLIKDL